MDSTCAASGFSGGISEDADSTCGAVLTGVVGIFEADAVVFLGSSSNERREKSSDGCSSPLEAVTEVFSLAGLISMVLVSLASLAESVAGIDSVEVCTVAVLVGGLVV